MPIKIDISKVPQDKLNDPDFLELYEGVQELFTSMLAVNSFCVHEAGHIIYYRRAGIPIHSIVGPSMTYEKKPAFSPARVQVEKSDIEKLGLEEEAVSKVATIHAAGKAFALALTSITVGGEEMDRVNFNDFCNLAKVPESERDAIWEKADEEIKKEIIKPTNEKEAWNEAYEVRRLLFGIPPPPGASAGHPLRIWKP